LPFLFLFKLLFKVTNYYGTIFKVHVAESNHTDFVGSPAAAVGIFLIDRLFTKVVQALSDVIFEPTINEQAHDAILRTPPKILA
jgi:hypothetical protein